jgi:hypothetical protein
MADCSDYSGPADSDHGRMEASTERPAGEILPPSVSWRERPLVEAERAKVRSILEACRDHDYAALQELAVSPGGLIEDEIRRTAC